MGKNSLRTTHGIASAGTGGLRVVVTMIAALVAILAFAGNAGAVTLTGGTGTDPWISSELPDYTAGSTVNLLGGSWQPGETVHVVVNDQVGQTWSWSDDVSADPNGDISDSFTLPNWFVANYGVTATGASGSVATSTFTDAISTTTSVTSNTNPSTQGQSITFTATVRYGASGGGHTAGDPVTVGTVKIGYGSNCQGGFTQIGSSGTPNASGQLSVTTNTLTAAGSPYAIWACYQGTGGSTGTGGSDNSGLLSQTVNGATASVSGTVYQDSNGNGSQDAGEPGIAGVGVSLSGTSSATATTNANGVYTFSSLNAGNYGVDYTVPTGYANTGTKPISTFAVAAGQAVTGKNFFARKQTSTSLARTAGVSPSTYGDAVTFTATVTSGAGNPSGEGTVQFKDGASTVAGCGAVALTGNTASCTVSKLGVAGSPHGLTAVYGGTTSGNGFAGSTSGSVTQSVSSKSLTVTGITASNKVYDGGTSATVDTSSAALSGVVPGDTVTLDTGGVSASFATKAVGTGKAVQVSGLTISGADAGNYTLSQPNGLTANITARDLTVTAHGVSKVYDGTAAATVSLTSDKLAGDTVSLGYASASFGDKNVGASKAVSVAGISISGADAGNYHLTGTSASTTADLTARDLTVSATGQDKVYDGTADATVSLSSDKVAGDAVTLAYTGAAFADKKVGSGKAVSVSGIAISGADAGNYHLLNTAASATADITARDLTVTANGQNKVYDGTAAATVSLASDKLAADTVTLAYTSASFDTKDVGSGKPVSVAGIAISGADAANYHLQNTTASTTADITAKALAVTGAVAQDKVYDGNDAATIDWSGAGLNGIASGDTVSIDHSGYAAHFDSKDVASNKPVTVSGVTLAGGDAGDYTVGQPAGLTADITAKQLSVSFHAADKTYDGTAAATIAATPAPSLVGLVAGDSVILDGSSAVASFGDRNAGTGKTVTASGFSTSGADAGNYVLASPQGTATADITPKALTVSGAAAQDKVYDGTATATVDFSGAGFVGVVGLDDVSLDHGSYTASFADKKVSSGKPVTVHGLALSGKDAGNYTVSQPGGLTAAITAKGLTISGAVANGKVYDGTDTATIDWSGAGLNGVVPGDAVSIDHSGSAARFDDKNVGTGKPVTVSGSGLSGADAANYTVSQPSGLSADVTARDLTVAASGHDKVYDGTADATVSLASDKLAGDAVTLAYTSACFGDKNVGPGKAVSVSGISISGGDAGNYHLTGTTAATTAAITARDLTVTAHGVNKVYDGTTAATVTLTTDKLAGDAVGASYTSASFANKNVGTGKAVGVSGISLSGADAGNYHLTATTAAATADITARDLTVTANGQSKVYDGTTAATVALSSDKVAGDSLTLGYGSAGFAGKHVGVAKAVGVSGISVSGADAGNYHLLNATASTTADITVRPITVTAVTDSKTYDGTTGSGATPTVSTGSIAAGDVADFSETFATKTVGTGKTLVPAGSVLDGNSGNDYAVSFANNTTGVIVPKTLTVTGITAASKPWDGTTAAIVDTTGATLNGVVSPDAVTLGLGGASGSFSSAAVGTWTVQIAGLTLSGADVGNYNLMQPTATASITSWNAAGKGFYAPVGVTSSLFTPAPAALPTPSSATVWNTVKGGQTVPLKFNVYAGSVERTALVDIASFTQANVPCSAGDGTDPVDITTTGNTSLRYDTTGMQWVQNWKTPSYSASASCFRATVKFADGSMLSAFFRLTK